ncbi:hypothetical protein NP233_g10434 [Leucocoprinus birnbaumii]|uniref:Uncharacterized protein n=1 Tax=Leucocoprinus birnbaumii TaxID=56174 RepID=A0AAD5YRW6_9AGAR|nr:hypothetical protein NP233_g10434 [Leucocoprinus birnbaumii]
MESSALKVAVREYLELLVTVCSLKVQADEATKLVTQLSKSKASPGEIKAHRMRYHTLYVQWESAMEPAKLAYQKAVGLKEKSVDDEVSIPSFNFLEGKKRNNDRALRLIELQAQLAAASADTKSGDTGPTMSSQIPGVETPEVNGAAAEGIDSAGKNSLPNAAPVISQPSAQETGDFVVQTADLPSRTTGSATKDTDATSITPETGTPGLAAPSLGSAILQAPVAATAAAEAPASVPATPAPQVVHASPPPAPTPPIAIPTAQTIPQVRVTSSSAGNLAGLVEHTVPNLTTPIDAPPIPSVRAPSLELLQARTSASYAPLPVDSVHPSVTATMGTSPASVQAPPNARLPVYTPAYTTQPHVAHPPPHTLNPSVASVGPLTANDVSPNPPALDTGRGSILPTGAGGNSVGFLNTANKGGARDLSSGALVNTGSNFRQWEQTGTEGAIPNFDGAAFGGYPYATGQGLPGSSSGGEHRQMTMLLGNDFVFNDMSLPSNHNHPGLSFDSIYNSFDAIPTAASASDNPPDQPKPSVPIKRSSDVDNDDRPAKKTAKKGNRQRASKSSGRSKAADPFIMFTPGTSGENSPQPPPPDTSSNTAVDQDSGKKKAHGKQRTNGKKDGDDDDDDNEAELAEASKAMAKARLELLPQDIPPFKPLFGASETSRLLFNETPNRPSMWFGIKKGKFEMVSDEWDEYLKNGTPISARSKNLITKYASILPRALTYSREVALYILTTDHGNIICPYHRWVSKKIANDVQFETQKPNHYFVTGVPGISRVKRVVKNVQQAVSKVADVVKSFATGNEPRPPTPPKEDPTKAEDDKPLEREEGKLHCGCIEDEVLLDLILWKSTLQQSPATGIVETWQDTFLEPRDRTFALRAYTFWTGLKADHLYEFGANGKRRDMIDITKYQIRFFRKRLQSLERNEKDLSGIIPDFEDLDTISFTDDEEDDDEEDDDEEDDDEEEEEGDEDEFENDGKDNGSDGNEDDENQEKLA